MAPIPNAPRDGSDTFRVFLTGFGPFSSHPIENPSWLAVQPLCDKTLPFPDHPKYKIHITAIQIPTSYTSILEIIPLVHARPPTVPSAKSSLSAPEKGYDFIMHCGAGPANLIRLERTGHKTGYNYPDAYGEFAPSTAGIGANEGLWKESADAIREKSRLKQSQNWREPYDYGIARGFPEGYEQSPLQVFNDRLDLYELEAFLKAKGVDPLVVSDDAGFYCCDYMSYCTLVSSQKITSKGGDGSPVLFMHVPPFGTVYSQERVTETIKATIQWACGNARV